jgi:hypothetical protein
MTTEANAMIHANAWRAALLSLFLGSSAAAIAQSPPAPGGDAKVPAADAKSTPADAKPAETKPVPASAAEATPGLTQFAWLEGCWRGSVNQREFREHWLPLRGNLLVGASQTVMNDKTLDFEYMRIEPRADGVYYVTAAQKKESDYRLAGVENSEGDVIFTFVNPAIEFPQKIIYRRSGAEGWLYATVEGKVKGAERKVIYPMRRINCESGEVIRK